MKFTLNSLDVVHSFWVPVFLFKRDVIPDHTNYFQVTATKTGTFIGRCTELCGIYHSLMLFKVKIVTPQQFRRSWPLNRPAEGGRCAVTATEHGITRP